MPKIYLLIFTDTSCRCFAYISKLYIIFQFFCFFAVFDAVYSLFFCYSVFDAVYSFVILFLMLFILLLFCFLFQHTQTSHNEEALKMFVHCVKCKFIFLVTFRKFRSTVINIKKLDLEVELNLKPLRDITI
jgi:hypothetical protein